MLNISKTLARELVFANIWSAHHSINIMYCSDIFQLNKDAQRNIKPSAYSFLLVEFIKQAVDSGMKLEQAVIQAAVVRAKPILLTAVAAMLGALFILDDPIFNGLAVALLFGILVSTVLTLLVIPVMYYAFTKDNIPSR
jgi:hypothetical protein